MPPLALTGGMDAGTLPATAASGNGGGSEAGWPIVTDEGIPVRVAVSPTAGLLLPGDGGKPLNSGSLPSVLPGAAVFMWLLPTPGKPDGLP